MKKRIKQPTKEHKDLHRDLATVMKAYPMLTPLDYMCVVAQLLGQLIAYQDQTKYTTDAIMSMVELNIQSGNKQAVDEFIKQDGTLQ